VTRASAHRYIVIDDQILSGEPIIKGTRTPVRAIVEMWRQGLRFFSELVKWFTRRPIVRSEPLEHSQERIATMSSSKTERACFFDSSEQVKRSGHGEPPYFESKEARPSVQNSYFDFFTEFRYSERQLKSLRQRSRARSKRNLGLINRPRGRAPPVALQVD
jgi:Protein of unknown function (DUF433)